MSIAFDLREAADSIELVSDAGREVGRREAAEHLAGLVVRLRAHADLLEHIEREMRECDVYVTPWKPRELADALRGDKQ